ncbi:MAG TPA: alpha-2-macroglobulin family protein [Chloroflexota bacterium]
MARHVSRRVFLAATAVSAVACGGIGVQPGTPEPVPGGLKGIDELAGSSPTPAVGPSARPTVVSARPDGFVAVAPRVLRGGGVEAVSLALFAGDQPASGDVRAQLVKDGQVVVEASAAIAGRGRLDLRLGRLAEGDYQLRVSGPGFQEQGPIRIEEGNLLFLETDKPVYKPGQIVQIRLLGLDPALRPAAGEAVVEVVDAQGIKVFRRSARLDELGMAALELPLSNEPNLGVWKLKAASGRRSAQLDVRVERYLLPKYELKLELARDWALASEPIKGTLAAEYTFGKPVVGEAELRAFRYVGTWQEYARLSRPIDGRAQLELPAVGYAAGSPAGKGLAQVRLDLVVREQSTGYEEKSSRLVTIAAAPTALRLIPEGGAFKPGLPFNLLVVAETPDRKPVDVDLRLAVSYRNASRQPIRTESPTARTQNGSVIVRLTPPPEAVQIDVEAQAGGAVPASVSLPAGHSPSGSFVHVEQLSAGALKVGDTARFKVSATRGGGAGYYYEVLARGRVVLSDVAAAGEIALPLGPAMAPEARLLVYQLLPNAEVAADFLPFKVQGDFPHKVKVGFERAEAGPGDELSVIVQTEGPARVGIAAVDRSVFVLAENRLNLQQLFDELERLYQRPQVELHQDGPGPMPLGRGGPPPLLPGARETFDRAGVLVLTNRQLPPGRRLEPPTPAILAAKPAAAPRAFEEGAAAKPAEAARAAPAAAPTSAPAKAADAAAPVDRDRLAEVQRVRQLFPETWLWRDLQTDAAGRASQRVQVPDSITTWSLRAVALSKERGLGVAEAELRVFQPFFVTVDLPYAAIRGEELPVRVALYNYRAEPQEIVVDFEAAGDWLDLVEARSTTVRVAANGVGAATFRVRPRGLGVQRLKVSARSPLAADAIVKEMLVEPEGVAREQVENLVLAPGAARELEVAFPPGIVPGSGRAYLAMTGNLMSQTIDGLEGLLRMPFGCGEQNMILLAPNVFVSRYLKESRQNKPEVMAKAEKLTLTGYQRQLTYRRPDGSFSAFGTSDREGSLWLSAFVLKTFAQARDLIFVDDAVLTALRAWIRGRQRPDGSFEPVGFVHHQEMLGGVQSRAALTAYVAIALREAGDDGAAAAERYLAGSLADEPYQLALGAYALALGKSGGAREALDRLLKLGRESDQGLSWDRPLPRPEPRPEGTRPVPLPQPGIAGREGRLPPPRPPAASLAVETAGYAALALLAAGDAANAGRVVRWLASRRNAQGGFGSTQDTVVALQAMASAAGRSRADVDATVALRAGAWRKEVRVGAETADVLQVVELPAGAGPLRVEASGRGQVMAQAVRRYNVPAVETAEQSAFEIDVRYGTESVAVDDLIRIEAEVRFRPPAPLAAGMVVLDLAVPTGFAAVPESIAALTARLPKLKRWELAGRKVILYLEDMLPDERVRIEFQARALFPVRAEAVVSQAYSYYRPEWRGEALAGRIRVGSA